MEAEAYPSKEEGKGSQGQDQPLGQVQSQMLGQKYSCQQLWWWLLHWVEKWLAKNTMEVSLQVSSFDFATPSCSGTQKAHLHWWTEELQPLLSSGEVGQVERDPLEATVGTCPEEKEAGGPGGLQRQNSSEKRAGGLTVPTPRQRAWLLGAVLHSGRPWLPLLICLFLIFSPLPAQNERFLSPGQVPEDKEGPL